MFKSDFQRWFESQPKHTQEWMKKQAIWHDRDMIKAGFIGMILGFIVACVIMI